MTSASDSREHAERYRIEGRLGSGGMGEVLRGVHVELGREVAIKRLKAEYSLDESILRRFENEARAVNLIRHENIVEVTDFYTDGDGRVHMVMELLQGRSLGDLIKRSAPLPPARVAHIGAQIADALGAAHEHGVIHRDLKPENIFLIRRKASDDYVKLLDFGIARLKPECGGLEATESGVIIGTPVYMSPEQAKGSHVDASTDMYSLGILLYEMLAGHWPFTRSSAVQMMMAHIEDDPKPLNVPEIPEEFGALISRCLAKKIEDRPQSMREVAELLETWGETTKFSESEELAVARGFSDTFVPQSDSGDEQTWDQESPGERALSVEEQTASSRPSGWVLGAFATAMLLAGLLGWWIIDGRNDASNRPHTEARSLLDTVTRGLGLPMAPSSCQAQDQETLSSLLRSIEFLVDGKPGGARPADTAALAELEILGNDIGPEPSMWRARAQLQAGHAQQALVDAGRALASCPAYAAAHATQGTAHAYLGNHAAAMKSLEEALTLRPDYVDARFNLALSQLASQHPGEARDSLNLVIEEQPDMPGARYLRGQCALQLGDAEAAVTDLALAVRAQSENAGAWYALGLAQHKLGKLSEASRAYCRAHELGDERAPCEDAFLPQ